MKDLLTRDVQQLGSDMVVSAVIEWFELPYVITDPMWVQVQVPVDLLPNQHLSNVPGKVKAGEMISSWLIP